MGQLIRATVNPLKTVHYSQPGRLVSSDSIDVERRKAIARHNAMRAHYAASSGVNDYRYLQEINQAFNQKPTTVQASSIAAPASSDAAFRQTVNTSNTPKAAMPVSAPSTPPVSQGQEATDISYHDSDSSYIPASGVSESQAAYTVQRGSFELRVAKGELAYLPPLDMTIIVQYPSIEFEYVGDFNYIPPRDEDCGEAIDLTT